MVRGGGVYIRCEPGKATNEKAMTATSTTTTTIPRTTSNSSGSTSDARTNRRRCERPVLQLIRRTNERTNGERSPKRLIVLSVSSWHDEETSRATRRTRERRNTSPRHTLPLSPNPTPRPPFAWHHHAYVRVPQTTTTTTTDTLACRKRDIDGILFFFFVLCRNRRLVTKRQSHCQMTHHILRFQPWIRHGGHDHAGVGCLSFSLSLEPLRQDTGRGCKPYPTALDGIYQQKRRM